MKPVFASGVVLAQLVAGTTAAAAHGGHVGELAGHAHWVGIAAVAAAAALAAGVALAGRRRCGESHAASKADVGATPEEGTV
ncbi:DUF6732 family protein [Stappia stellulata]|uniref:DUF6732 family protein n=1 Tax=Stappia stellulata TaxID=71235 RepID=UPI0003FD0F91|nr:DUF6732 family protein [Stappia stellulata]